MADALATAISQYRVLSGAAAESASAPAVHSSQLDKGWFEITYALDDGADKTTYRLRLSNAPEEVGANIERAAKLFTEFTKRHAGAGTGDTAGDAHTATESFPSTNFRFSHRDIFKQIFEAGEQLRLDPHSPLPSNGLSEMLAWLAIMKQHLIRLELSDLLASRSLSAYFLAHPSQSAGDRSAYRKGLLLLALDYPAAAEDALSRASGEDPAVALLLASIRGDIDVLQRLASSSNLNPRITGFLLARAYMKSGRWARMDHTFNRLLLSYPGFQLAKPHLMVSGDVGSARSQSVGLLEDLLAAHFNIISEYVDTDWVSNNAQFEADVRRSVPEESAAQKWLVLHSRFLDENARLSSTDVFLDMGLLRTYLKEEVLEALALLYTTEANRLARRDRAQRIVEIATAVYPGSDFSEALQIHSLIAHTSSTALNRVSALKPASSSLYLLGAAEAAYRRWALAYTFYNKAISLMRAFHSRLSPNARGLRALQRLHSRFHYEPYEATIASMALRVDPYDHDLYSLEADRRGDGSVFEDHYESMRQSYGFLMAAGTWHESRGDHEKAITYYERAITVAPEADYAYSEFGDLYRKRNEHEKAIEIWSRYLELDDHSLDAMLMRTKIGDLYGELARYEEAYAIVEIAKKSGHESALLEFAEASERMGKILQAERYFKHAAERYPGGSSAVALAAYYWRQENDAAAVNVIRSHKRQGGRILLQTALPSLPRARQAAGRDGGSNADRRRPAGRECRRCMRKDVC